MNTDSYEIYPTEAAAKAAEARGEPLVYGAPEQLEKLQARLMNRQERRLAARQGRRPKGRR